MHMGGKRSRTMHCGANEQPTIHLVSSSSILHQSQAAEHCGQLQPRLTDTRRSSAPLQPLQPMARAQCDLGDRLACDEAELEGFRPAAAPAGGASPLSVPPAPAAALALSVLLILSLLSRLLVQQRSRRPGQPGSVALPRGRCAFCSPHALGLPPPSPAATSPMHLSLDLCRRLMSAPAPTAEHAVQQQQQQPPRAAPSPRLPAVAATAAAAQRRSPTAAALVSAADTAASLLLLPVSVLQAAKYVVLGSRAATAPPATPVAPVGPSSRQGGSSGRRTVHYGLGYGTCIGAERRCMLDVLTTCPQAAQKQGLLRPTQARWSLKRTSGRAVRAN